MAWSRFLGTKKFCKKSILPTAWGFCWVLLPKMTMVSAALSTLLWWVGTDLLLTWRETGNGTAEMFGAGSVWKLPAKREVRCWCEQQGPDVCLCCCTGALQVEDAALLCWKNKFSYCLAAADWYVSLHSLARLILANVCQILLLHIKIRSYEWVFFLCVFQKTGPALTSTFSCFCCFFAFCHFTYWKMECKMKKRKSLLTSKRNTALHYSA